MSYAEFLRRKTIDGELCGFEPLWIPASLFPFQVALVDWSVRKGKAAIFADCGLGKTPMQLVWAENIVRKTNRPVLVLTPLAVAAQTIEEGIKFGVECHRAGDGSIAAGVNVANYERLHYFKPEDFAGVVCDESSCIKAFSGERRKAVTEFLRHIPYRLLCTATAAPNDYIELGTSSEALGQLGHMDMLARFFRNDQNTCDTKKKWRTQSSTEGGWRFKGHAEEPFWRWVCSWARACRRPSDLGFDDNGFVLPPMEERQHVVKARTLAEGMLFSMPAVNLAEQREERRRTIAERCEKVAEIVSDIDGPCVSWCHLNDEGDLLTKLIPGAVQVSGKDSDEEKEAKFLAFLHGSINRLIIKPKIGAWGLNWQHCSRATFFPSHSFEQYYQGTRRLWRFGQERTVEVDIVTTEGEATVLQNLQRKARQSEQMFSALVRNMNNALHVERSNTFTQEEEVPSWLSPISV